MSVKREVSEKNRKFNSNWEERYFFTNDNVKPVSCEVAVLKEFSFKEALQHQTGEDIREIPRKP